VLCRCLIPEPVSSYLNMYGGSSIVILASVLHLPSLTCVGMHRIKYLIWKGLVISLLIDLLFIGIS
jgi:hypothetical protein